MFAQWQWDVRNVEQKTFHKGAPLLKIYFYPLEFFRCRCTIQLLLLVIILTVDSTKIFQDAEIGKYNVDRLAGGLKYIICTRAGEGPATLSSDQHLINAQGEPKFLSQ